METQVSFLLSDKMAKKAINMVRPTIAAMMNAGLFKRNTLHIVIMNPAIHPRDVENELDAILYEETIGDPSVVWKNPYDEIARAKALASWRTGFPMHTIRETMPYLLQADEDRSDTLFAGSAVLLGVVVGVSGVQSWFDELVAYMVAAACRALCIQVMQEKYIPEGETGRRFMWERKQDDKNPGSR